MADRSAADTLKEAAKELRVSADLRALRGDHGFIVAHVRDLADDLEQLSKEL